MKITIDIGPISKFVQRAGGEGGWPESRRVRTVRVLKAIKTDRGHGKLVVRAYCAVYDRKNPWKAGRPSMQEQRTKNKAARQAKWEQTEAGQAAAAAYLN